MADFLKNIMSNIPLETIQEIQKAIQYFYLVPESERQQTAMRITARLAVLDETVNISNRHPIIKYIKSDAYAEFIDWGYKGTRRKVQFITVPEYELRSNIISSLDDYINSIADSKILIEGDARAMLDKIFTRDSNLYNIVSLYRPAHYSKQLTDYTTKRNIAIVWYYLNNIVLNYCNKMVLSFMKDSGIDTYQLELMNSYMLDINEMAMCKTYTTNEVVQTIYKYTDKINLLPLEFTGIYNLLMSKERLEDMSEGTRQLMYSIGDKITNAFLVDGFMSLNQQSHVDWDNLQPILPASFIDKSNTVNMLERYKQDRDTELYAHIDIDDIKQKKFIYQYSEAMSSNQFMWIQDTIQYLNSAPLKKFKLTMAGEEMHLNVTLDKMYALKSCKIISSFIQLPYQGLTLGCVKKTCYILATKLDKIYMIPIFMGNENSLVRQVVELNKRLTVRVITMTNNEPRDLMSSALMVIESANKIEFDEGANLKLSFKRTDRNTYMNKYSDIHTVLVHNSKNKNYEAMKTDLARLYGLIYIIERDVTHSHKAVSPSVKADGTKARMFAKNDLKRYLEEVTKYDKNFNLSQYFENSKVKETIEKEYEVKINAIGVKKLISTFI